MLAVSGSFPTWRQTDSSVTLTLRRDATTVEKLVSQRFSNFGDKAWLRLELETPAAPRVYHLEASDPTGRVGWWSQTDDKLAGGEAFADGTAVPGDRTLRTTLADLETKRLRDFFTFRKPQPDYFQGPTQP